MASTRDPFRRQMGSESMESSKDFMGVRISWGFNRLGGFGGFGGFGGAAMTLETADVLSEFMIWPCLNYRYTFEHEVIRRTS